MNRIIIKRWYGRLGNNIIQLINAIQTGLLNNYNTVIFPPHKELKSTHIIITDIKYFKKEDLIDYYHDNFYWYSIRNIVPIDTNSIVYIFEKYIKSMLIYNIDYSLEYNSAIHIRGGDTLNNSEYVPVPLYFINHIQSDDLIIVSEDTVQPTVKYLIENKLANWTRNSIEKDLNILSNARKLGLSYGTFSLLALLLNNKFTDIFVTDYIYYSLRDNWKFDIKTYIKPHQKLHVIELPGYFNVGEYKYSNESVKTILEYKPQN